VEKLSLNAGILHLHSVIRATTLKLGTGVLSGYAVLGCSVITKGGSIVIPPQASAVLKGVSLIVGSGAGAASSASGIRGGVPNSSGSANAAAVQTEEDDGTALELSGTGSLLLQAGATLSIEPGSTFRAVGKTEILQGVGGGYIGVCSVLAFCLLALGLQNAN
jgi:hypothetical protein